MKATITNGADERLLRMSAGGAWWQSRLLWSIGSRAVCVWRAVLVIASIVQGCLASTNCLSDMAAGGPQPRMVMPQGTCRWLVAAFSPECRFVAAGGYVEERGRDHALAAIWNVASRRTEAIVDGAYACFESVAFNEDSVLLLTAGPGNPACLRNWKEGKVVHQMQGSNAWFSYDGNRVFTLQPRLSMAVSRCWDVATGGEVPWPGPVFPLSRSFYDPEERIDGDGGLKRTILDTPFIVTMGRQDRQTSLSVWNQAERRRTATLVSPSWSAVDEGGVPIGPLMDVAVSLDGTKLALNVASRGSAVELWDVRMRRQIACVSTQVCGLAFSPNGKRLVTVNRKQPGCSVWDATTGRSLGVLDGHGGRVSGFAWSPDSSGIVTVSLADAQLVVWREIGDSAGITNVVRYALPRVRRAEGWRERE